MSELINQEFLKYRKVIASLLRKIRPSASEQDIEDILQDTYINTHQSSLKQEIRFPKAFMVKTAIRLANRYTKVAQRTELHEQIDDVSDQKMINYGLHGFANQTEADVLKREDFAMLCEAVDQLPHQCRKVFILKKIYGLSQREIAQKMCVSESTVEKHVAKGLLKTMQFYETKNQQADLNIASVEPLFDSNKRQKKDSQN